MTNFVLSAVTLQHSREHRFNFCVTMLLHDKTNRRMPWHPPTLSAMSVRVGWAGPDSQYRPYM